MMPAVLQHHLTKRRVTGLGCLSPSFTDKRCSSNKFLVCWLMWLSAAAFCFLLSAFCSLLLHFGLMLLSLQITSVLTASFGVSFNTHIGLRCGPAALDPNRLELQEVRLCLSKADFSRYNCRWAQQLHLCSIPWYIGKHCSMYSARCRTLHSSTSLAALWGGTTSGPLLNGLEAHRAQLQDVTCCRLTWCARCTCMQALPALLLCTCAALSSLTCVNLLYKK